MSEQQRETEFVTGVVGGIIQKAADKWQIQVTPAGSQYTKNLWTKSQDQVNTATALIGQTATFECGVSHWMREGQPVTSLWVNAINPGSAPPAATAVREAAPSGDPRQESIERQVALKAAVDFYAGGTVAVDVVLDTAGRFDTFLASGRAEPASEDTPSEPSHGGDEDIPF